MDLKSIIILSEISQRKTSALSFDIHMESKTENKWTNQTKEKETQRCGEQTSGFQRGGGEGGQNTWRELKGTNFDL